MPAYPNLARQASLQGTFKVVVDIAEDGSGRVVPPSGRTLFHQEIVGVISKSKFHPACSSQRLELTFVFELLLPPVERPRDIVVWKPPATFLIRTHFGRPNINMQPAAPSTKR